MTLTRLAAPDAVTEALYAQAPRFFLWVPVWLGVGTAAYFSLRFEPSWAVYAALAAIVLVSGFGTLRGGDVLRIVFWLPLLVSLGFCLTAWRSHSVAAPKLGWHYYGAVEGRIVHLDRSASDVIRVTLADPILERLAPEKTPERVRLALHSKVDGTKLSPGARIMLTGHLSPPGGPVEPGGFDFQRKAWFSELGAVGYTRAPPMLALPPQNGDWADKLFRWRMATADWLRDGIQGQRGAFAAAILAGDRSAIDPARLEDLRRSNLAHLLAISGLHMGLLTGFVFALVRFGLAAIPPIALRIPGKKIAAVAALIAGAAYLGLSGASIATQRAFVMVAVMLVAVLCDKAAISLRSVAIAATVLLVLRPESLTEPGFQMSFAATTALVATFEALNRTDLWRRLQHGWGKQFAPALSLLMASFVAAAATAPISAYHFNTVAQYGLIANLLSVPVMSIIVMPSGVIALALANVGLDAPALWVMGQGIGWILNVAAWVSGIEAAVIRIPAGPIQAPAIIMLGLLWLVIWRGLPRFGGTLGVVAGIAVWVVSERPDVLVTDNGRLVGVATDAGRALNRARGNGFAASTWLENDGDARPQSAAAERYDFGKGAWTIERPTYSMSYLPGKELDLAKISALCAGRDVVILPNFDAAPNGCLALTRKTLIDRGAASLTIGQTGKLEILHVRDVTGERLWNKRR